MKYTAEFKLNGGSTKTAIFSAKNTTTANFKLNQLYKYFSEENKVLNCTLTNSKGKKSTISWYGKGR